MLIDKKSRFTSKSLHGHSKIMYMVCMFEGYTLFVVDKEQSLYLNSGNAEKTASGQDELICFPVEIIGSVSNIGSALGYPAGLIYEQFGRFHSFGLALGLTGIPLLLLFASQYSIMFYHTYWPLLGLWFFLFGMRLDIRSHFELFR